MKKSTKGTIVFTALELVTLVGWLILAGVPFNPSPKSIAAVAVLAVGLFLEHRASVNVGAGRPIFGPLPPDEEHGD